MPRLTSALLLFCAISVGGSVLILGTGEPGQRDIGAAKPQTVERDRSPVDLVLAGDDSWLVTANQTSGTASLVRTSDGKLLDEVAVGRRPNAVTRYGDDRVLVTARDSGEVTMLQIAGEKLKRLGTIRVGYHPYGVAASPDGKTAYVALSAAAQVAVIDLAEKKVVERIDVGRWPRYLALSPDGSRLTVGCSGDKGVWIVDTAKRKVVFSKQFRAFNIAHMQCSPDGKNVYFPWTLYGGNPTNAGSIRRGWVLANRVSRISLEDPKQTGGLSIDGTGQGRGHAAADPHGLAITPDGSRMLITAAGSHELLNFRLRDLPLIGIGGSDHMDPAIRLDKERFSRIPLGGRPMAVRVARDSRTVYVANYLDNSVQVIDLQEGKVTKTISLGGPKEPSLARRGEAIFHDGGRSLESWYSCQSCHYEGGGNSETMDTLNDGTTFTYKTVLPLYDVTRTGPWTWHGWQKDFSAAMHKSLTGTMQGPAPTKADVAALTAYLDTLQPPPNPHRQSDGSISAAAGRGKKVFNSESAGCAACHSGNYLTDGEIHDVGLGRSEDRYQGFNTPSLRGLWAKVRLLHHGGAKSLDELLRGPHSPEKVSGEEPLSDEQRSDLIEYLKTL
jgi:YVTN family beta-propeller protein